MEVKLKNSPSIDRNDQFFSPPTKASNWGLVSKIFDFYPSSCWLVNLSGVFWRKYKIRKRRRDGSRYKILITWFDQASQIKFDFICRLCQKGLLIMVTYSRYITCADLNSAKNLAEFLLIPVCRWKVSIFAAKGKTIMWFIPIDECNWLKNQTKFPSYNYNSKFLNMDYSE